MGFRTFTSAALLGVMLTGCGSGGGGSNNGSENNNGDNASTPQDNAVATTTCQTELDSIFDDLLAETNSARTANGVAALSFSYKLGQSAQTHAEDMANGDYFAHTSPSGSTLASRIDAVDYDYSTAGENLAAGYTSASAAVTAWLNSPGHRKNLLNPNFVNVGFGLIWDDFHSANASATYDNYWVQNFGSPTDSNTDTVDAYLTDNCNIGTIVSSESDVLSGTIGETLPIDTPSVVIGENSAISALFIVAANYDNEASSVPTFSESSSVASTTLAGEPSNTSTFSESSLVASATLVGIHDESEPISTPEPAIALGLMPVSFVVLRSRQKRKSSFRSAAPKLH